MTTTTDTGSSVRHRLPYWDNIKGLLIMLVVFGHILYELQYRSFIIDRTVDHIYMFHMPAFIFISGYFGKKADSGSKRSAVKLIFLYFIFNSIAGFIYGFGSLLEPMFSYWYLVSLLIWRLTTPYIAKIKHIELILLTVALLAGFYPSVDNTFALARTIGFYPYYISGYLLAKEKQDAILQKPYGKRLLIGLTYAAVSIGTAAAIRWFFKFSDEELLMCGYDDPMCAFGRITLYGVGFTAIWALRYLMPDRKLPILTLFGRNSLWIYLLHRPFAFLISDQIKIHKLDFGAHLLITLAAACTLIICTVLGCDPLAKLMGRFAEGGADIHSGKKTRNVIAARIAAGGVAAWFCFSVVLNIYRDELSLGKKNEEPAEEDEIYVLDSGEEHGIYPILSSEKKQELDKAFRLTFAGDLILLEDQVKRGYTGSGYDFSDVLEYCTEHISTADLAAGVLEGPMAGEEAGYSSGNFADAKEFYLNFPDSFGRAIRDAGFDLLTLADNHILDKGVPGMKRTLDQLDMLGIEHTGAYRNEAEKERNHVKLIERDGIKMAVLSYTYGCNYQDTAKLAEGELSYVTSLVSGTEGELFDKLKASVEQDFADAKALSPDLIIVMPHLGTQFSNEPNDEQNVWFNIFKENGADIILGDHPHVVQPAVIENYRGRTVFTAYCPGHIADAYRGDQSETGLLLDVYIDRETKKVIGGSAVTLYSQARADGNFRALPVYKINSDPVLRSQLSTDDLDRANAANKLMTKLLFGSEMDLTTASGPYYFGEEGFERTKASGLELTDEMRGSRLFTELSECRSVCFIGDSVTEGSMNGGCPWYEPITEYFGDKTIYNFSKGGCTVSYMTDKEQLRRIPETDLYVIAIGVNDVALRNPDTCAMTETDFVRRIGELKSALEARSPEARFVFIAPWYSADGDPYCPLSYAERRKLRDLYSDALKAFCKSGDAGFIDPVPALEEVFAVTPDRVYLVDYIHPNCGKGVLLYSSKVLEYTEDE